MSNLTGFSRIAALGLLVLLSAGQAPAATFTLKEPTVSTQSISFETTFIRTSTGYLPATPPQNNTLGTFTVAFDFDPSMVDGSAAVVIAITGGILDTANYTISKSLDGDSTLLVTVTHAENVADVTAIADTPYNLFTLRFPLKGAGAYAGVRWNSSNANVSVLDDNGTPLPHFNGTPFGENSFSYEASSGIVGFNDYITGCDLRAITGTPSTTVAAATAYIFSPNLPTNCAVVYFTAEGLPAWLTLDTSNGTIAGTPAASDAGMNGPITLTYSNGLRGVSLPDFSIEVTAPPPFCLSTPTLTGTPAGQVRAGLPYEFVPEASDGCGALTYSITNLPGWASFDAQTGALTGTPQAADAGTFNDVVITVTDDNAEFATIGPFSIEVLTACTDPSLSGTPASVVVVGSPFSFTPTLTGGCAGGVRFTTTGRPGWLLLDNTTGALTGTPAGVHADSTANIVLRVTTDDDRTDELSFSVQVVGAPYLLSQSQEPATPQQCPAGGVRIDSGYDNGDGSGIPGNGTLEPGEIDSTLYVCNGTNGTNGTNGSDGADVLVTSAVLGTGDTNCPNGGIQIDAGTDNGDNNGVAGNGVLESGEVDTTSHVCNGVDGYEALVATTPEAPGNACPAGGEKIEVGIDDDRSGILDSAEVDHTTYVCNGLDGLTTLVTITDEEPGTNCVAGGEKVEAGLDLDASGILDSAEVTETVFVCDGVDAVQVLVRVTAEPAGVNCAAGGQKVESGGDDDASGALEENEVDSATYVCNGVDGRTSLVVASDEAAGQNCAAGGQRIDSGLDLDQSGILEATEITDTTYVCNGVNGIDATQVLISVQTEDPGDNCAAGGQKIEAGGDDDGSGVLDEDEVEQTTYVCNGLNEEQALIETTDEPAGENCEAGGQKVVAGIDSDRSGTLEVSEITSTVYVCDGADGADGADAPKVLGRTTQLEVGHPVCTEGGLLFEVGIDDDADGELEPHEIDSESVACNGEDGVVDTDADGVDDRLKVVGGTSCAALQSDMSLMGLFALVVFARRRRRG